MFSLTGLQKRETDFFYLWDLTWCYGRYIHVKVDQIKKHESR